MKRSTGTLFALLLTSVAANGQDHITPIRPSAAKAGAADRVAALAIQAKADGPKTVYVPIVRSERLSHQESLRLTEILNKAIEEQTPFKVVSTREEADLVFWGSFKTADHTQK